MDHRILGTSGLRVSLVGLGCNNFGGRIDVAQARAVVDAALDSGITLFDVADVYGRRGAHRGASEEILGRVLGARRDDIVLATKFGMAMDDAGTLSGGAKAYVTAAAEASLKRLGTDRIDLYQMHQPDPATPIEETLLALDGLIRAGKVRAIGCSNFSPDQVMAAAQAAKTLGVEAFVTCQDELSLLVRDAERDLLPTMRKQGLGLLPYFPLASGMLTGKYSRDAQAPAESRFGAWSDMAGRYFTDANWTLVERLTAVADAQGTSLLDLAFGWLASKPEVSSIIAGATSPEQIRRNVAAGTNPLAPETLAAIDAALA